MASYLKAPGDTEFRGFKIDVVRFEGGPRRRDHDVRLGAVPGVRAAADALRSAQPLSSERRIARRDATAVTHRHDRAGLRQRRHADRGPRRAVRRRTARTPRCRPRSSRRSRRCRAGRHRRGRRGRGPNPPQPASPRSCAGSAPSAMRRPVPPSWPVAGSTPAVPPIVIESPTFATWLYGPIGIGVFGGVIVSTLGTAVTSNRSDPVLSWRA